MGKFNPKDHLIDLRGKKYLDVRKRLVWFRLEHPQGSVQTEIVSQEPPVVRANVYNNDGVLIATGHGSAIAPPPKKNKEGQLVEVVWKGREIEKAETAAIGRALGHAGYGTDDAMNYVVRAIADQTPLEDVKARLGSGSNRRMATATNGNLAHKVEPDNEPDQISMVEPETANDSAPNAENAENSPVASKNGNSQSKRVATDTAPHGGEIRIFTFNQFRPRQKDGKTRWQLEATDNTIIWAYSRDIFRALGYSDEQMKGWEKLGYVGALEQDYEIQAKWVEMDNGGYWNVIVPDPESEETE